MIMFGIVFYFFSKLYNNYLIHLRPSTIKIKIIVSNLNVVKKNYLPVCEVVTRTRIYGCIDKKGLALRCVNYGISVWPINGNLAEDWRQY